MGKAAIAFLQTNAGQLTVRLIVSGLKILLFYISLRIPSLGLGPDIDKIAQESAPVLAIAIIGAWTKLQHRGTQKRIRKALMTPPPVETATVKEG